jgi:hypothetical protein
MDDGNNEPRHTCPYFDGLITVLAKQKPMRNHVELRAARKLSRRPPFGVCRCKVHQFTAKQ